MTPLYGRGTSDGQARQYTGSSEMDLGGEAGTEQCKIYGLKEWLWSRVRLKEYGREINVEAHKFSTIVLDFPS